MLTPCPTCPSLTGSAITEFQTMPEVSDHFELALRPTRFDPSFANAGSTSGLESWELRDLGGNTALQKCEVSYLPSKPPFANLPVRRTESSE